PQRHRYRLREQRADGNRSLPGGPSSRVTHGDKLRIPTEPRTSKVKGKQIRLKQFPSRSNERRIRNHELDKKPQGRPGREPDRAAPRRRDLNLQIRQFTSEHAYHLP